MFLIYSKLFKKTDLSNKYNVTGIPLLILIDPDSDKSINLDARLSVELDKEATQFPWKNESSEAKTSIDQRKLPALRPIQDFDSSSKIIKKF